MRKWLPIVLALLVPAVVASVWWCFYRPGRFSSFNYERIHPGMTLTEVEKLLGQRGMPQTEKQLPRIVDWSVPVDHPKRIKAVVSGEEYYRWNETGGNTVLDGGAEIIISLRDGVVSEKWYWEPSL